jgi:hypothetical protein
VNPDRPLVFTVTYKRGVPNPSHPIASHDAPLQSTCSSPTVSGSTALPPWPPALLQPLASAPLRLPGQPRRSIASPAQAGGAAGALPSMAMANGTPQEVARPRKMRHAGPLAVPRAPPRPTASRPELHIDLPSPTLISTSILRRRPHQEQHCLRLTRHCHPHRNGPWVAVKPC